MKRDAALLAWFSSAIPGVAAYPVSAVPSKASGDPEDAAFPYLTYTDANAEFGVEVALTVDLWHYTSEEAGPNADAQTLFNKLGSSGEIVHYDGGAFWLKRGSPFSQVVREKDAKLKHKRINITKEDLSQ